MLQKERIEMTKRKMMKYLVYPDTVRSENDGESHFISGDALIRLYGVDPNECRIVNDHRDVQGLTERMIPLKPRTRGDYREHLAKMQKRRKD